MKSIVTVAACLLISGAALAQAQAPASPRIPPLEQKPKGPPTFFVTSVGLGKGGDLGGLEGADKHCQDLAQAAGIGNHTWRAYLSTQAEKGKKAINARDRIGKGPWFNLKGARIAASVGDLHGDTLEQARNGNLISKGSATGIATSEAAPNCSAAMGIKPNLSKVIAERSRRRVGRFR